MSINAIKHIAKFSWPSILAWLPFPPAHRHRVYNWPFPSLRFLCINSCGNHISSFFVLLALSSWFQTNIVLACEQSRLCFLLWRSNLRVLLFYGYFQQMGFQKVLHHWHHNGIDETKIFTFLKYLAFFRNICVYLTFQFWKHEVTTNFIHNNCR